jgi:pimeloyl-ACP methyl ester carboxylesterase
MSTLTTRDGTEIYYKDWGSGRPIVFSHGWHLSADDWDSQMFFWRREVSGASPTIVAGTGDRAKLGMVMIWILTPMI